MRERGGYGAGPIGGCVVGGGGWATFGFYWWWLGGWMDGLEQRNGCSTYFGLVSDVLACTSTFPVLSKIYCGVCASFVLMNLRFMFTFVTCSCLQE